MYYIHKLQGHNKSVAIRADTVRGDEVVSTKQCAPPHSAEAITHVILSSVTN